MKLYLSSYRVGNNSQQLIDLVGSNKKVAVIPNALDYALDDEHLDRRNKSIQRDMDDMKSLGFSPTELSLKDYFKKPAELEKILPAYGLIWVRGGNAFLLRKAMRMSELDKWLSKSLENNDFVYGGFSAGVCVLTPSLKGLELVDDPYVMADGYTNDLIWDGLGIVDWGFAPHYKSDHPESEKMNSLINYYIDNKISFKALRDGEAVIIGGNN